MALNTVTLKWDLADLIQAGVAATLSITPTAQLSDSTDHILIPPVARTFTFTGGTGQLAGIIANDNDSIAPANSGYLITVTSATGQIIVPQFQTQLLFSNGAVQWLDALAIVPSVATSYQYLPLPSGSPSSGQVPAATGNGEASAWTTLTAALVGATSVLSQTGVKTSAYAASANQLVPVSTASGAVTVTLPGAPAAGAIVGVKMVIQASTNAVTVACAGSDVLNKSGGSTTYTLSLLNQGVLLEYNSGIWLILSDDLPLAQLDARYTAAGVTRSRTLVVASAAASAADKAAADYVCDGTADDVQINAAFAALPSIGGTVYLTEGTFYISSPIVPVVSSTRLCGAGIGATSVNLANGANCNGYQFTSSTASLIFCSIMSLTLEGNNQNNASGYGVYIDPTSGQTFWDFHLRDVDTVGWAQDNFWAYDGHGYVLDHIIAEGAGGWGINMPNTGNGGQAEIRNSTIKENLGGGIQIAVSGSVVAECEVANNTGYGIQALSPVTIRDNTVYSNTLSGIYMDANTTLGCRAEGNVVFGNTQHGILALATGSNIIDNWLSGNSAGSNSFDEIQVQRGYSVVAFNYVNGGSQSRYGINFNGTNSFSGNRCYGNVVQSEHTALYNFGTGSVTTARDNAGFNPVGTVSVSVPSSGSAVAAQAYDRTFYITAGSSTVTCAIQNGPSPVIPANSFATIRVPATLTMTPTYSNAPTWVVEGE